MLPRALITAKEQCLCAQAGKVQARLPELGMHVYTLRYVRCSPVSVVLVVFGRVDHGASFDANLLEQIPHFLVDVLLNKERLGLDTCLRDTK